MRRPRVSIYTYDPLDDLTNVNQSGQLRNFVYDSLKRLVGATNPENFTAGVNAAQSCGGGYYAICYSYDAVGNLLTKKDNRGAVINYTYDQLNRVTAKTYTVPSGVAATQSVSYCYDGLYTTSCPSTGSVPFLGRLTGVTNGQSTTLYTNFDALGRVLNQSQLTAGSTYPFIYSYNRAGTLTSETYPSGRVVNTYDGANRVSQVTLGGCGSTTSTNYAANVQYAPHGAPWAYTMGNSVTHALTYNSRLQTCGIQDVLGGTWQIQACGTAAVTGGTTYLTASLNWGTTNDNGNLQGSTYTHFGGTGLTSSLTFADTFTYDTVNRLARVADVTGSQTNYTRNFAYDPFGNMFVSGKQGIVPPGNTPTSYVFNGNNQLTTETYDAAGNDTGANGNTITYDAESRQTPVVGMGVNESYVYDGDGKRVEKVNYGGSPTTVFVYDAFGHLATEASNQSTTPSCVTCYLSGDHLGTNRLVTDSSGNVVARHDYLPFGEEIAANTGGRTSSQWGAPSDSINQKFTGKERDSESGLDYFGARYYGSALGRFTSPDWSAKPSPVPYANFNSPQTLNQYAYVLNNPLSKPDLDGHVAPTMCGGQDKQTCQAAIDKTVQVEKKAISAVLGIASMVTTGGVSTVLGLASVVIGNSGDSGQQQQNARAATAGQKPVVAQPDPNGQFAASSGGTTVKIPSGYSARPADNGKGTVYAPEGSSTNSNANTIRIMDPNTQNPTGYIRVYNSSGQPINPATGNPAGAAETHIPIKVTPPE